MDRIVVDNVGSLPTITRRDGIEIESKSTVIAKRTVDLGKPL
jgi:hypothetical protein